MPRSRIAHHLVALTAMVVLTSAWVAGVASAATATDVDGDGLPNTYERDWTKTNPSNRDTDRDGILDGSEDPDHDRLTNKQEYITGTRPHTQDTDGDGRRDDVEDADADGLWNWSDFRAVLSPRLKDTDGNGVSDPREDRDRDGLRNLAEQQAGTHPDRQDTDSDGYRDGTEVTAGTNPLSAASHPSGPVDAAPTLSGAPNCPIFPAGNVWNTRIDGRSVAANSSTMIAAIGLDRGLHMDFGSYAGYGIPYQVVSASTARSTVSLRVRRRVRPRRLSHPGVAAHRGRCRAPTGIATSSWSTGTVAGCSSCSRPTVPTARGTPAVARPGTCDRTRFARPAGRAPTRPACPSCPGSSATTRSLPARSATRCASRPTGPGRRYIYPARHEAGTSTSTSLPPMGLRVRLKASYVTSGLSPQARVIAEALKRYGMILADNGSPWYISGASDARFDDDVLHELDDITGRDLEVVDTAGLVNGS